MGRVIVAIDPDTVVVPLAVFTDGVLTKVSACNLMYVKREFDNILSAADGVVNIHVEAPAEYGYASVNIANRLKKVIDTYRAVLKEFDYVKMYTHLPSQYKGQVPKKIFIDRVITALTKEERELLNTFKGYPHYLDMCDAVGLAMWAEKRIKIGGVV